MVRQAAVRYLFAACMQQQRHHEPHHEPGFTSLRKPVLTARVFEPFFFFPFDQVFRPVPKCMYAWIHRRSMIGNISKAFRISQGRSEPEPASQAILGVMI